jgi:hypothetical protein
MNRTLVCLGNRQHFDGKPESIIFFKVLQSKAFKEFIMILVIINYCIVIAFADLACICISIVVF